MALVALLAAGCRANDDEPTSTESSITTPAEAARAGFETWAAGWDGEARLVAVAEISRRGNDALVAVTADVRDDPSSDWALVNVNVPVNRVAGRWAPPSPEVFEQVIDAGSSASGAVLQRASATRRTPTLDGVPATPSPVAGTVVPLPPPGEGEVIFEADWASGLGGWIGPSEWSAGDGYLANNGARETVEPWIEAPVQVEPWRDMAVEFEADVVPSDLGSFGLVARAGPSGMFLVGLRGEGPGQDGAAVSAFIDAIVRGITRLERESLSATRTDLTSGWHLYRVEFRGASVSLRIDGSEVVRVSEQPFTPGRFLGLWSASTSLQVRNYRVIGL